MLVEIQQTSLLVVGVVVAWINLDGREFDAVPYWYAAMLIVSTILAGLVLVVSTLIRIWS